MGSNKKTFKYSVSNIQKSNFFLLLCIFLAMRYFKTKIRKWELLIRFSFILGWMWLLSYRIWMWYSIIQNIWRYKASLVIAIFSIIIDQWLKDRQILLQVLPVNREILRVDRRVLQVDRRVQQGDRRVLRAGRRILRVEKRVLRLGEEYCEWPGK